MTELLKQELERTEELIRLLKEKQSSLDKENYSISSALSFLQAVKNHIIDDDTTDPIKVKELLHKKEEEVKELLQ